MPALNFQKQFVKSVEFGKKRQTIRAMRKRPFRVGDKLYLYYGMRTKQCRKLGESKALFVGDIYIEKTYLITINGNHQYEDQIINLAKLDGFKSPKEMARWFEKNHGLPFEGQIIKW